MRCSSGVLALCSAMLFLWLAFGGPLESREAAAQRAGTQPTVWVLDLTGPIGPALGDYVARNLARANQQAVAAVVLRIDTPGGLDSSMRDIIESILASRIPVIGFVAPSGARAASAGTYILYATHVAAMAPATTIGAATPVQISPLPSLGRNPGKPSDPEDSSETDSTGESGQANPANAHPTIADKAMSDAIAYIRGLAQLRGRNVEWAVKAVAEAASLSANEALADDVVDLIANDVYDLLAKVDGTTIGVVGAETTLITNQAELKFITPDWRTELLAIITNPTVAYLLLMIGMYGLIFEFWNPGTIGPGIIGAICLLLGLYALQFLPVNFTGLALIALGVAFMIAEAFIPSLGIVGIGGLVAFVAGSVMLLDTDVPGFRVSLWVIGALATTGASLFLTVFALMAKARRRPVVSGPEELPGSTGNVIDWDNGHGRVRAHGEIWQATADASMTAGTRVRIAGRDGLVLKVQPLNGNSHQEREP